MMFIWLASSDYMTAHAVSMGCYASGGDGKDNCIVGTIEYTYTDGALRLGKGDWTSIDYPYKQDKPLEGFEKVDSQRVCLAWTTEFSQFRDSITEKRKPTCTGHDGRAALALRESYEKGSTVQIKSSLF